MKNEELVLKLKSMGYFFKDKVNEAFLELIDEECRKSREIQRHNDIINVVVTLSETGHKEPELYELLSKFWGIDSRAEATEYIKLGRYVEWPYSRLKEFLRNEGINGKGLVDYMRKHDVRRKLQNNPRLCELTVDKLKKELEN